MRPPPRTPPTWPHLELPIAPPYPPMEARLVAAVPSGAGWLYEPKWDGFRCLAFRDGDSIVLQSKAGQPLGATFGKWWPPSASCCPRAPSSTAS